MLVQWTSTLCLFHIAKKNWVQIHFKASHGKGIQAVFPSPTGNPLKIMPLEL